MILHRLRPVKMQDGAELAYVTTSVVVRRLLNLASTCKEMHKLVVDIGLPSLARQVHTTPPPSTPPPPTTTPTPQECSFPEPAGHLQEDAQVGGGHWPLHAGSRGFPYPLHVHMVT